MKEFIQIVMGFEFVCWLYNEFRNLPEYSRLGYSSVYPNKKQIFNGHECSETLCFLPNGNFVGPTYLQNNCFQFFIMLHDTKEHLLKSFQNNALMILIFYQVLRCHKRFRKSHYLL